MAARPSFAAKRGRTAFAAGMVGQGAAFKRGRSAPWVPRAAAFRGRRAAAGDVGPELKFHDVDVDMTGADHSAGVILNTSSINLIAQGVTESTRIGRKCVIRSIGWRGNVDYAVATGAGAADADQLRLMLVLDKQANGAAPAVTDVLESANIHSFNNLSNKGRFRVLSDKIHFLNVVGAAGDGTTHDYMIVKEPIEFFKQVNIPLEFSAGTGAITEIRSNNLFILAISQLASTSTSIDSKVRLRFSDG